MTGDRYADALAASEIWAQSSGAMQVHAFDQIETLLGQGTLGLELSKQAPDVDTVLAAVGGGGHIGGIAAWYRGDVRVVGVEPRLAPTLYDALKAGHPVDAPAGSVAADSLAPRRVGELAFPIAKAFVDRVVLVDDDDILRAQATLWDAARIVAEPGGATALAALLSGAYQPAPSERVAVIVCGGNTTAVQFDRLTHVFASGPRPDGSLVHGRHRRHAAVRELLQPLSFPRFRRVDVAARIGGDAVHTVELARLPAAVAKAGQHLEAESRSST